MTNVFWCLYLWHRRLIVLLAWVKQGFNSVFSIIIWLEYMVLRNVWDSALHLSINQAPWNSLRLLNLFPCPRLLSFSHSEESPCLLKRHVLLLGYRGSGKTSSCITITGQGEGPAKQPTKEASLCTKTLDCGQLLLVDTPGWSMEGGDVVAERLDEQNSMSALIRHLCYPGVHALLLVVPIGESFTEQHRQGMLERLERAGMHVWRYAMVLFTGADRLWGNGVEEFIAEGGTALQRLVERCGNRYHALDNTCSENGTQVSYQYKNVQC